MSHTKHVMSFLARAGVFDENHPLWSLFIRFHSNQITDPEQRRDAKALLFGVHYGNVDTQKAFVEAARVKSLLDRLHKTSDGSDQGHA